MTITTPAEQLAYGPDDAARLCSIGRSTLYRLIQSGEIRTVKVGARTLIPASELRRFLGE